MILQPLWCPDTGVHCSGHRTAAYVTWMLAWGVVTCNLMFFLFNMLKVVNLSWCCYVGYSTDSTVVNCDEFDRSIDQHVPMGRIHSFPRQILLNSAGQFAEFCSSPWQNCLNSAVYRGCPFVNKLSSILCINFSYWRLALCLVMLATFKENCQFFSFQKCNLSSQIVFIYYYVP